MRNTTDLLQRIDAAKARLDALRPLPAHTAASLRDHLALEWTYHSNGIEGNTLTLRETKVVLEGITVGWRSLREHLEAINHQDAIEFIEGMVESSAPLTECAIKDMHALVLRGIDTKRAGRYRQKNVHISGASTMPPDFMQLPEVMQAFHTWHVQKRDEHPIRHAAMLHTRFVEIHPFIDGNGRTGRLLMNLVLMQAGYPPAILRVEDRLSYYDALDEACATGNYDGLTQLVGEGVERSLEAYLALLEPQHTPIPHRPEPGL
jgi:Fic family protein